MTDLFLLLKDDYSIRKSYEIPTGDRAINYITVELEENSDIASHISDYTFMLIIKLPSGKKAAYTLTPNTGNKFEKLTVPTAFSFFGEGTKVFIDIYNDSELVAQSDELSYVLQNVDKVVPTLLITENGIYDVTKYDKVNCDVIDPVNELNDGFEKTLVGSDDSGYEAQNPLSDNISQAISDFGAIKTAIENKGVQIPSGTATSQYTVCINNIPSGGSDELLKSLIEGSANGVILPYGVASIREYCFYKSTITSMTVPDSVTRIGNYAFAQCRNLVSIVLSNNLTSIGDNTFSECSSLAAVVIPSGVSILPRSSFSYCTNLVSVSIPNTVSYINDSAFRNCSSLTSIALPESITGLDSNAFANCVNLVSVNISSRITRIGPYTFYGCSSLPSIALPNNINRIDDHVFENCVSLSDINIPSSLTYVNNSTFNNCTSLSNVTIGSGFNANNLNLSASTLYSAQTIVSWLNALADRTGQTAYTLTIGSANLAKLTAEEIAIATNKNWNLA